MYPRCLESCQNFGFVLLWWFVLSSDESHLAVLPVWCERTKKHLLSVRWFESRQWQKKKFKLLTKTELITADASTISKTLGPSVEWYNWPNMTAEPHQKFDSSSWEAFHSARSANVVFNSTLSPHVTDPYVSVQVSQFQYKSSSPGSSNKSWTCPKCKTNLRTFW